MMVYVGADAQASRTGASSVDGSLLKGATKYVFCCVVRARLDSILQDLGSLIERDGSSVTLHFRWRRAHIMPEREKLDGPPWILDKLGKGFLNPLTS